MGTPGLFPKFKCLIFIGKTTFFSIEPLELKSLVENIRIVEKAMGKVCYGPTEDEKLRGTPRRSLFAVKDIQAGELLTEENVRSIRPGYGLAPKYFHKVMGKRAKINIKVGQPLKWSIVSNE